MIIQKMLVYWFLCSFVHLFSVVKVKVQGQNRHAENLPLVIAQPDIKISLLNLAIYKCWAIRNNSDRKYDGLAEVHFLSVFS